jgi:hypothetical protein
MEWKESESREAGSGAIARSHDVYAVRARPLCRLQRIRRQRLRIVSCRSDIISELDFSLTERNAETEHSEPEAPVDYTTGREADLQWTGRREERRARWKVMALRRDGFTERDTAADIESGIGSGGRGEATETETYRRWGQTLLLRVWMWVMGRWTEGNEREVKRGESEMWCAARGKQQPGAGAPPGRDISARTWPALRRVWHLRSDCQHNEPAHLVSSNASPAHVSLMHVHNHYPTIVQSRVQTMLGL